MYAVVTNSTYDGLCYNAARVEALLEKSSDRIHFDEAWYGYARFNPMYENHFAMRGDPAAHKGPTVFATHSTHKLLAALSQASYIHVRDGKGAIDHHRFNQAYMMHTSDLAALRDRRLERHHLGDDGRQRRPLAHAGGDRGGGRLPPGGGPHPARVRATRRTGSSSRGTSRRSRTRAAARWRSRTRRRSCSPTARSPWILRPGDKWHGFDDIADDWCMLDPIKVSILAPGMGEDGKLEKTGVPAALVNA